MVNGLGVLGWGVGGIEAEAAMLGQPVSMLLPEVIGFQLTGKLKEGVTATDLVLTVTQMLRKKGVVGKFVEFFGPGLSNMTLADRATIGNMAPGIWRDLRLLPGRRRDHPTTSPCPAAPKTASRWSRPIPRRKACGATPARPIRSSPTLLELDLGDGRAVDGRPEASGRPHAAGRHRRRLRQGDGDGIQEDRRARPSAIAVEGADFDLGHGDVVIAAITSCTNTSNPCVLIAAGLLARNADGAGLKQKPWVKTSLAPGSQVVAEYLDKSGLQKELDQLGFNLVGFGCTTCIGNSGPLPAPISKTINDKGLIAAAVLSGNRNFEGRVSPDVQANYLASPPLVVAYALAGTVTKDLTTEPLGEDQRRQPGLPQGHLADLARRSRSSSPRTSPANCSRRKYADVFKGDENWQAVKAPAGQTYAWDDNSTYVQNPPYFVGMRQDARRRQRHQGRARPRPVRRQDHHRPHLAGRLDQGGLAGRQISHRITASASPTSTSTARGAATMK